MTILVAGATGNVGRQVVHHLVQMGQPVRALTRNPAKAKFPPEVEVVVGDLMQPDTLAPLLAGVTAMHLINFGGDDYAQLETGPQIVELARQAGVRRVTILQGGEHSPVEDAVQASDLEWTLLRPMEFMSGAYDWAESIRTESVVRDGFGGRLSAMIDEYDIGAVAAKVLVEGGYHGQTLSLTGPEVLTVPQKVQAIADALGRDIQFIELSEAEAREVWRQGGFPEDAIEFFVMVYSNTPPDGYTVVPTVEQVTGRPPRRFAEWAVKHAEAFR